MSDFGTPLLIPSWSFIHSKYLLPVSPVPGTLLSSRDTGWDLQARSLRIHILLGKVENLVIRLQVALH